MLLDLYEAGDSRKRMEEKTILTQCIFRILYARETAALCCSGPATFSENVVLEHFYRGMNMANKAVSKDDRQNRYGGVMIRHALALVPSLAECHFTAYSD